MIKYIKKYYVILTSKNRLFNELKTMSRHSCVPRGLESRRFLFDFFSADITKIFYTEKIRRLNIYIYTGIHTSLSVFRDDVFSDFLTRREASSRTQTRSFPWETFDFIYIYFFSYFIFRRFEDLRVYLFESLTLKILLQLDFLI